MTRKDFENFLAKQATSAATEAVDWSKTLAEWLTHLDDFYRQIDSYLSPFIKSQKLSITNSNKTLNEDNLGSYPVRESTITFGRNTIQIVPVGRLIVAARGRVDLIGPKGSIRFVLVPENSNGPLIRVLSGDAKKAAIPSLPPEGKLIWKILTPPPAIQYLPLTDESFYSSLMDVSNG